MRGAALAVGTAGSALLVMAAWPLSVLRFLGVVAGVALILLAQVVEVMGDRRPGGQR